MSDQLQERQNKLDALLAGGENPYELKSEEAILWTSIAHARHNFKPEFTKETGPIYKVIGRIALKRGHGKLQFLTITSEDGSIQIAIDQSRFDGQDKQRSWLNIQNLDAGDIVLVHGNLAPTQRGEITIWATELKIISKALTPPPDKVHGLADPELRYRLRHVDMWTNPNVMSVFKKRSQIIRTIRTFMHSLEYDEVETPSMHVLPGGATANPFVTHHKALDMSLYMRIAPELYLKKLLIGGMQRVFEIGKNFRNEGISQRHNPEFTAMEAYCAYGNSESMMRLVMHLIQHIAIIMQSENDLSVFPFKEHEIDYTHFSPFKTVTLQELVPDGTPEKRQEIYENEIEPTLIQPTFVLHSPRSMSPLARPFPDGSPNAGYADTFELVIGGMEIAPGYTELNDPRVQRQNFEAQAKDGHVMDQDFIEALKVGMPPAGGLGLGIDRLVMLLTNQASIRDVIAFPTLKPPKE